MPIEEILTAAELITQVAPIPYMPLVIKALKMMLLAQPVAVGIAGRFVPKDESEDVDSKRKMFDAMWNTVLADNVITDEEQKFLRPHALAAGISEEEFERMVTTMNHKH